MKYICRVCNPEDPCIIECKDGFDIPPERCVYEKGCAKWEPYYNRFKCESCDKECVIRVVPSNMELPSICPYGITPVPKFYNMIDDNYIGGD